MPPKTRAGKRKIATEETVPDLAKTSAVSEKSSVPKKRRGAAKDAPKAKVVPEVAPEVVHEVVEPVHAAASAPPETSVLPAASASTVTPLETVAARKPAASPKA